MVTPTSAPPSVSSDRGRHLVWAAFALAMAPTLFVFSLVANGRASYLPKVLIQAGITVFVLARCYRGDVWARWLILAAVGWGVLQGVAGFLDPGEMPRWAGVGQVAWAMSVILLLQAPAARRFLRARLEQRRRTSRPAV